jgi:hypothetical protein
VMLFQQREKGLRPTAIARYLNANAPWSPPPTKKKGGKPGEMTQGWHGSYVQKLLTFRAVIGEYQPCRKPHGKQVPDGDPILNYYPNLLEKHPGLFESVQQEIDRNRGKGQGGRNDKANNLLLKLVRCAYCGGPMHYVNKGQWQYLRCYNGMHGVKCNTERPYGIPYGEVEALVLNNCPKLRPDLVLPDEKEQNAVVQSLLQNVDRLAAQIEYTRRVIDNLNDSLENENDAEQRSDLGRRVKQRRQEIKDLKEQLTNDKRELDRVERGRKSFENWQAKFESLSHAITDKKNVELRLRLNAHLREFIDHVEVFATGHRNLHDPATEDGDNFAEELVAAFEDLIPNFPTKDDWDFIRYVEQRRMTKEGRFIRIHWRSGGQIDLVPKGSLASGIAGLGRNVDEHEFEYYVEIARPNIEELHKEFTAKTNKRR